MSLLESTEDSDPLALFAKRFRDHEMFQRQEIARLTKKQIPFFWTQDSTHHFPQVSPLRPAMSEEVLLFHQQPARWKFQTQIPVDESCLIQHVEVVCQFILPLQGLFPLEYRFSKDQIKFRALAFDQEDKKAQEPKTSCWYLEFNPWIARAPTKVPQSLRISVYFAGKTASYGVNEIRRGDASFVVLPVWEQLVPTDLDSGRMISLVEKKGKWRRRNTVVSRAKDGMLMIRGEGKSFALGKGVPWTFFRQSMVASGVGALLRFCASDSKTRFQKILAPCRICKLFNTLDGTCLVVEGEKPEQLWRTQYSPIKEETTV